MAAVFFLSQSTFVRAAGETGITLNSPEVKEGDSKITVTCDLEGAQTVTNGKIRILYDSGKLSLLENTSGAALDGALCEINDCLSGNKEEGEMVIAFASASPIRQDGPMLHMTFGLDDSVEEGDTLEIRASVEKLSGDDGDFTPKEESLLLKVSGKGKEDLPDIDHEPDKDREDDQEGIPNVSDQGTAANKTNTPKQSEKKGGTTRSESVKTGDETDIVPLVLLMAAGGIGAVYIVIKQKMKE